jgi:hypothetical protein
VDLLKNLTLGALLSRKHEHGAGDKPRSIGMLGGAIQLDGGSIGMLGGAITNIQTHGLRKLNKKLIECYMVCYMVLCVFGLLQERWLRMISFRRKKLQMALAFAIRDFRPG